MHEKGIYNFMTEQKIPIEDDPYWRVSGIYMDAHRIGRFFSRFERFDDMHPEWTDDLMEGVPTYYCVLGVVRGATEDEMEQAYERKSRFSSYPDETIEEAFDTLSDPGLRKEYDDLLFIFEQITKSMPAQEKNELIENNKETFLSVLGLDRNSLSGDKKEVERTIREKYRYLEKTAQVNLAYSVLKNTSQREDYLWLLENHEMLNTLFNLFKKEQEEAPEEIKRKEMPDMKEVLEALTDLLAERARREARKGKDEMPSMNDVMNALSDLLSEKEKEGKRSPKRARRG